MSNYQILIVEDNRINQQLLEHWFMAKHIQYQIAQNGLEAIELISSNDFHLILLDVQMPEMDGYEVAQLLRQKLHISTPIIAMTAHAMGSERDKCLQAGMNDYISKPIAEAVLFSLMRKYLPDVKHNPLLNIDYLKEISSGNEDFIRDLLQQFTIQAKSELQKLSEAVKNNDTVTAKSIAHSMLTTFGYLGLSPEQLLPLQELENGLSFTRMQEKVKEISILYQTLCMECKEYIASSSSTKD